MINPHKPRTASEAASPKLISRPRQYVDVNDLRSLLKLGLGLHTIGDPVRRLTRAMDGLARLANADAWVMQAFNGSVLPDPKAQLFGGKDLLAAQAAAMRIDSECSDLKTSIGRLIAAKHTPGRVLAVIDGRNSAIQSVLREERSGRGKPRLTWISIHRNVTTPPLIERERRMVELFHSQSAWLLLQIAHE